MPSDALVAMIERKLNAYGLKKVVPDDDTLEEAYRAFHRSRGLRKTFEAVEKDYDAKAKDVAVPKDLQTSVARDSRPAPRPQMGRRGAAGARQARDQARSGRQGEGQEESRRLHRRR